MPPLSESDKTSDEPPCEYYIPVELVERRLEAVKTSKQHQGLIVIDMTSL